MLFHLCIFGIACSSSTILRIRSHTSSRTKRQPWGREAFPGEAAVNKLAKTVFRIIKVCEAMNVYWNVESLHPSRLWDLPQLQLFMKNKPRVRSTVVERMTLRALCQITL